MKFITVAVALLATVALAQETTQPIVIAHRGASGYLPEHTLPAKALAYAQGVDFLEQDVVLSRDDILVVLHDIYLDTISDVAERFPGRQRRDGRYYVLDFTLTELKQLRVVERFNRETGRPVYPGRFPTGEGEFRVSTLDEELQMIRGLNRSTGRKVGIYVEIKQPKWHREQGRDISVRVLSVLARYGYATKADACWLQCFELDEVRRLRTELGWRGRLLMLLGAGAKGEDGTDFAFLSSTGGLAQLAKIVDGIGPAIGRVATWSQGGKRSLSPLVKEAHALGLAVHPYTVRVDDLPRDCASADELHAALIAAGIDGVFSDFPDVTVAFVAAKTDARTPH